MDNIPFPLSPHKVEPGPVDFTELKGELYADCRRVRVSVLTQGEGHRPSLDFRISDASDNELSRSVIVENYDQKTEFTMHLLRPDYALPLTLSCKAYFENTGFSTERSVQITSM